MWPDPYRDPPAEPGPERPPPGPRQPPPAPIPPELPSWLEERMFSQRIVVLHGPVTQGSATRASAALMTLDALSREPISLHVNCPDGDLDAVFALVDTLDTVTAPVHALATAEVGGAATGVYVAAPRRLAYPHARFRLAEPPAATLAGTADEVVAAAGRHLSAVEELAVRIADATGRTRSRVEDDLATGRLLSAEEAREYGLVHEIVSGRP